MVRETERLASDAKGRLLAIFDVMDHWFHEDAFSGCMFINASAEFADLKNPCHILCAEHKRLICDYLADLAQQAEVKNSQELSKQLNLLIEGAIVNAYVEGDIDAAKRAKAMAAIIIAHADV